MNDRHGQNAGSPPAELDAALPLRVLVGIDGSAHAERALRLVAGSTWPEGTRFRLVHALPPPVMSLEGLAYYDVGAIRTEIERDLDRLRSVFADPAVADIAVREGRPADAILGEAAAFAADVVVVGHRGHGRVLALIIGSTAAEVAERSTVPVLVAVRDSISPIVLGDDGSRESIAARAVLVRWPLFQGCQVRVVSAVPPLPPIRLTLVPSAMHVGSEVVAAPWTAMMDEHRRIVDRSVEQLRAGGLVADGSAEIGSPADMILDIAQQSGAGLVVVGSRGRSGLGSIIGSVARSVLLRSQCSVLVVHAPAAGS